MKTTPTAERRRFTKKCTMEAVKAFNGELYSLNDYKPPISKAKMTQITKSAIKAIKFYKHVVQSVEKFVQKCKPEYKVPGLYVIDSIVRQSRHQFSQEKDVFGPRFSKNIIGTFQNLYRCPSDDKSKIVRVLNLWQKNSVFKSDIVQPLLDMAAGLPPPSLTPVPATSTAPFNNATPGTPATPSTPANVAQSIPDWASQLTNTDTMATVAQILQSPQGQQLQQLVQSLQQQQKPQPSLLQALDAGLVVQLQALTAQLTAAAAPPVALNPLDQRLSSFSQKLLDRFDFGEDSERQKQDAKKSAPSPQLPVVSDSSINSSIFHQLAEQLQQQNLKQLQNQLLERQQSQQQASSQESQESMFGSEDLATPPQSTGQQQEVDSKMDDSVDHQQQDMDLYDDQDVLEGESFELEQKAVLDTLSRTRSRSRSRSPRKQRSRSRSGSRKRKHRKRSRSRSRDRRRKSLRSYSSERQTREQEKERQKKGLPPIRSKTLSVCSTTLWVGQVKKATQQDLTNLFEEFGQVESINIIPPRGCAYICMVHRQDAYRARQQLATGSYKMGSRVIKIAWALNKGVNQEYKQLWDMDLGVTYIPWEKVKLDHLDNFAEGGIIDQETVNSEWEAARNAEPPKEAPGQAAVSTDASGSSTPQAEAFGPQVAMMPAQMQVSQGISAVGLAPPSFPVTMAMPPPGFGLPHHFLRAGFSASQPPPGFMPALVPQPAAVPSAATSLVQPSLTLAQENAPEAVFRGMIPAVGSLPGGFIPRAVPRAAIFNPAGLQHQQAAGDGTRDTGKPDAGMDITLQGMQNAVAAGMGLLGMHPSAALARSLPPPGLPGQMMPGLLPLDARAALLQGAGPRFSLLMQHSLAHQASRLALAPAMDLAGQAGAPGPFPRLDPFGRAQGVSGRSPGQPAEALAKPEDLPNGSVTDIGAQQDGDQDYRFPPAEKLRMAVEQREAASRPPLPEPQEDSSGEPQVSLRPESRWAPPRGDYDERRVGGPPAGSPKGFQSDRPGSSADFPKRPESRRDSRGGGPPWNRRGGTFNPGAHREFDDRRRPWERQQGERDERDLHFRRETNGNRFGGERERDFERNRDRDAERNRARNRERERERESRGNERKRRESAPPGPQPPAPPAVPQEPADGEEQKKPLRVNGGPCEATPTPEASRGQPPVPETHVASPKDIAAGQSESWRNEEADKQPVGERIQTEGT